MIAAQEQHHPNPNLVIKLRIAMTHVRGAVTRVAAILLACGALDAARSHASSAFTLPSGVRVEIVESAFHKDEFQVSGCTGGESRCRINGHVPFGATGSIPKTYVKAITISFQGRSSRCLRHV